MKATAKPLFLGALLGLLLGGCAEMKSAGTKIGNTTKEVATTIGTGVRDVAVEVKDEVKEGLK